MKEKERKDEELKKERVMEVKNIVEEWEIWDEKCYGTLGT